MNQLWIIEARNEDGSLLLGEYPQPESVFGMGAIRGMTDWQMARVIYARNSECTLIGSNVPEWPKLLNPKWTARKKTW